MQEQSPSSQSSSTDTLQEVIQDAWESLGEEGGSDTVDD